MSLKDYIFNSDVKKIKVDFPSGCNANCVGCYTHSSEKDPKKKLGLDTIKDLLDQAADLGIKQLVIAADGEPLMDKDYFFGVIGYASEKGMESIIYTNGSLISPEVAERLYSLNTSLFIKRNSMDHERQNGLLQADLSERMMKGVYNLKAAGFNHDRLALQSYVSKKNCKDLDDVLRFCRINDVLPYFEEFIALNQPAGIVKGEVLSKEGLLKSFRRYQSIDRNEFGIETEVVPGSRKYGISVCSVKNIISIDTKGDIKRCIFDKAYGNVYTDRLKEVYAKIPSTCEGCSLTVFK